MNKGVLKMLPDSLGIFVLCTPVFFCLLYFFFFFNQDFFFSETAKLFYE